MYQINNFSLSKLNNAEFVAYCVNLANLIERSEAAKLGLEPNLIDTYADVQKKLIDQVYTTSTSPYTLTMKAADTKRSKIYKRIQLKMQIICQAEDGSQLLQFKDDLESVILSKYTMAVTTLPQQEESAVLQGFIHDLRTEFSEDEIDDMDLTSDLSNLESANQEFIAAYANRNDERAQSDTGVTQKLRSQMIELVAQIYFGLQYMANSMLEANATKAVACQACIRSLNVILSDTKKRWRQRTSGVVVEEGDVNGGNTGGNTAGGGSGATAGGTTGTGGNTGNNGSTGTNGNNGAGSTGNTGTGSTGNDGGGTTGNTTGGTTGNTDPVIDHENGTVHDGTVEF